MGVPKDEFDYGSTTVPEGALFVAADEPLLIYPSVRAAERNLEAIDVENGVYPGAYGPNGEPYRIGTYGRRVVIERTGEPDRPDELKSLLRRYLQGVGDPSTESNSLSELAAQAWRNESEFWQEHDPYGERFSTAIPAWGCGLFLIVIAVGVWLVSR